MKKSLRICVAIMTLLVLAVSVCAANSSAFDKTYVNADTTVLYDDPATKDLGGWGKEIAYYDKLGVGLTSKNDHVMFKSLDFGKNGANKMIVNFGYGNDDGTKTTLAVYIDSIESDPVCTYEIGFTGGWGDTEDQFKEQVAEVNIPGGVHDVYVQFTNEKSGSFNYIRFEEAPAKAVSTAAKTADIASVAVLGAIAAIAVGTVIGNKTKTR